MKNKTIAIICAMDKERESFLSILNNIEVTHILNQEFLDGTYHSNKIIITVCGIGKVNAAIISTLLLEHFNPDLVINSGIAGGYNRTLKTLDVLVCDKIVYSDVDMTSDDFSEVKYGQLQDMPPYFMTDRVIFESFKKLNIGPFIHYGDIASGDQFVTDYKKVSTLIQDHLSDYNIFACDMESASIAHTCFLFKKPVFIVRAISDIIGSNVPLEYTSFSNKASNEAMKIVMAIIDEISF